MKNSKIESIDSFSHIFDDDFGRNMRKTLDKKHRDMLESETDRELPIRGKPKDVKISK